jgi:hypothetical protein
MKHTDLIQFVADYNDCYEEQQAIQQKAQAQLIQKATSIFMFLDISFNIKDLRNLEKIILLNDVLKELKTIELDAKYVGDKLREYYVEDCEVFIWSCNMIELDKKKVEYKIFMDSDKKIMFIHYKVIS